MRDGSKNQSHCYRNTHVIGAPPLNFPNEPMLSIVTVASAVLGVATLPRAPLPSWQGSRPCLHHRCTTMIIEETPLPQTFEPQGDPLQAILCLFVIAAPFSYWWFITVPEARLALSKDKRLGETGEYLADLATSSDPRPVERWVCWRLLTPGPLGHRTARDAVRSDPNDRGSSLFVDAVLLQVAAQGAQEA